MAPAYEDDLSDSDEEVMPELETSVWLGFPDEAIEDVAETKDAAVSRIGGHPVRFTLPMYLLCINTISIFFLHIFQRPFFLRLCPPFLLLSARVALVPWNFLLKCIARCPTAQWIGHCIFGDAPG